MVCCHCVCASLPPLMHHPATSAPAAMLLLCALEQVWCGAYRPEAAHQLITTDPHSPPKYRCAHLDLVCSDNSFAAPAIVCLWFELTAVVVLVCSVIGAVSNSK